MDGKIFFETIQKKFDNPHYVDVQLTDFNYINIWFCDENGNKINFQDKVYVKLHFRPKK